MIYHKLIINDQSYEVSCQDTNFVPCPMRFSCPAEKINLLEKIGEWKCLQWWGITQSFATLLFDSWLDLSSTVVSRYLEH